MGAAGGRLIGEISARDRNYMELHEVAEKEFARKGFMLVRGVFNPSEVAELHRRADAIVADHAAYQRRNAEEATQISAAHAMLGTADSSAHLVEQQRRLQEYPEIEVSPRYLRRENRIYPKRRSSVDPVEREAAVANGNPWAAFTGQIFGLADCDDAFARAAVHPRIAGVLREVLAPNVKLWSDHIFAKGALNDAPPYHGANRFHQDGFFQFDRRTVTCWMALDAVTEENGPFHYIPLDAGLSAAGYGRFDFDDLGLEGLPRELLDAAEIVTLEPGDMAVHDRWVLHATGPNESTGSRCGWALHYTDARARLGEFDRPRPDATCFAKVTVEGYHIRNGKLSGNRAWPVVCGQAVPGGI